MPAKKEFIWTSAKCPQLAVAIGNLFSPKWLFTVKGRCMLFHRVIFSKGVQSFCLVSTHVDDIFVLFNKAGKIFRDELFKKILTDIKIENLGPVSWAPKNFDPARQGVRKNKNFSRAVYSRVFSKRGRVASPFSWDQVSCD